MNKQAQFRVVKIDPNGSGMDYSNHLGNLVDDAKRCCKNCTIIFAGDGEFGPFTRQELEPLNDAARKIHLEIDEFLNSVRGGNE